MLPPGVKSVIIDIMHSDATWKAVDRALEVLVREGGGVGTDIANWLWSPSAPNTRDSDQEASSSDSPAAVSSGGTDEVVVHRDHCDISDDGEYTLCTHSYISHGWEDM